MEEFIGALSENVPSSSDIVQHLRRQNIITTTQSSNHFIDSNLGASEVSATVSNAASCSTTPNVNTSTLASTPIIITTNNGSQNQNHVNNCDNIEQKGNLSNSGSSISSYSSSSSCNEPDMQHSSTSVASSASCDNITNNLQINNATNMMTSLNIETPSTSNSGAVYTATTPACSSNCQSANDENVVGNPDILDDTAGAVGGVDLSNRRPDPNNLFEGLHPMITAASTASTTSYMLQPSTSASTNLLPAPDCPICLQTCIHPARLPCGHIFCFLCIKGVAYKNRRCAMCRREIPTEYLNHPNLLNGINDIAVTKTTEDGYQWFYEGRNGGWWAYDCRTATYIEEHFQFYQQQQKQKQQQLDEAKEKLNESYNTRYRQQSRQQSQHQKSNVDKSWWQYDDRTSQDLEDTFKNDEKSCTILVAGYVYIVDFELMIQQRQNEPARCRRVKRDLATIPKKGVAGLRIEGNIVTTDINFTSQQPNRINLIPRSSFNFPNHNSIGISSLNALDSSDNLNYNRQQMFHRPAVGFGLADNHDNLSISSTDSMQIADLSFSSQLNASHPQLFLRSHEFNVPNYHHNSNGLASTLDATDAAIRIATNIIDSSLANAHDEYREPSPHSLNFSVIDDLLNNDRLNVNNQHIPSTSSCLTRSPTGTRTVSVTAPEDNINNIYTNNNFRRRHSSTTTSMGEPNLNNISLNRNLRSSVSSISQMVTQNSINGAGTAALVIAIANDRLRLEACENMLARNRDNLASVFERDFNNILRASVDCLQPRHRSIATSTDELNIDNIALNRNESSASSLNSQILTSNLANNADLTAAVAGMNTDWHRLEDCESLSTASERDNQNIMEIPTSLIQASQRNSDSDNVSMTTTSNINNRYTTESDYIDNVLNEYRSLSLTEIFDPDNEENNIDLHNELLIHPNVITLNNSDSNYSIEVGVGRRNTETNHSGNNGGLDNAENEARLLGARYPNDMPLYISSHSHQNCRDQQYPSAISNLSQHQTDRQLLHSQHQQHYQGWQHQLHRHLRLSTPSRHYAINDLPSSNHQDENDDEVADIISSQPYRRHYRF